MPTPTRSPRLAVLSLGLLASLAHAQTNGTWNVNANGNWSAAGSWFNGTLADGAGSTADFTQVNLTGARTATIDTTSRTIGTLLLGDTDGTHGYTIAASGGASLTFNNNGLGASITQISTSAANTISTPVSLADNLGVSNNSASALTISGTVSSGTAGTKTITNAGTGAGGVTLSGVISNGGGSVAIVQNSATSTLTLSGANTFDTGVEIKQGTVLANNNAALGTGTVLLGDTSGSADATLAIGSFTVANNIVVQAGSTGKLTIAGNGGAAARPTGNITLNNDLTLSVTSSGAGRSTGAFLATTGAISGTGDLNLDVSGGLSTSNNTGQPQMDSLSVGGSISTTGTINNVGAGNGRAIITGNITNAASVNQDSATSMLTLSGANTYTGATNVNAGTLRISSLTALPASNTVNVASGATLQIGTSSGTAFGAGTTANISGHGNSATLGAIEATNTANYAGAVVLQNDATIGSGLSTLTLSGTITGSGKNLTVSGAGATTISTDVNLGSGGLTKNGTGTLTLSAANSYTGVTTLNQGATLLSNANALGGGGAITFAGGSLRHGASNGVDYASRIVNSTGPVAIDTGGANVVYSGNIDATNSGGLLKLGSGRLTLSGANAFSGPIVVNGGTLTVSATSALPSIGDGILFIDSSAALNTGGAYANVQAWLDSDNINTASTGAIALAGSSSENIDFTGYDYLSLGTFTNATYTGTLTAANSTYRLGGGLATLTLSNANALTGANGLVVNGSVTLSNANDLSGATTINSGTLALGAAGTIANSAVAAGPGSIFAITAATSGSPVTRAAALELNRATLTVTGNATANSTDAITGALTIGSGGNSIVTLTPNAGKNTLLTAGSLVREAGATAIIRGTDLGVSSLASAVAGDSNISFASAPTLVGGAGANTTDGGIIVGMVGDTASNGTGFAATGGLLTYDATRGLRLLGASEYKTSITSGQTQLDNIKLSQTAAGTGTTTISAETTVNSLSLYTSGNTGATLLVDGSGKLTLNSGVIYANSVTSTTASTVSAAVDFNGREGVVLSGGSADLVLSGALSNTGGNGLTIYASSGRSVTLSGASANTYTGLTTVNGGTLNLNKTSGNAVTGDLLINSGAVVSHSRSNQIADTATVTVDGGSFDYLSETIGALNVTNGGSVTAGATTTALVVTGATTLSNGGTLTFSRSQNINGAYDSTATLGGLNITHKSSGDYTAVTLNHGSGMGQSGAKLILGGDVTFTGNATNTHTVLIDAIKGTGRQGVIDLTAAGGNRTFNIGNGAAASDLRITAALLDGAGGASNLVKTGLGVLALSGANTYSGNTVVSAGGLVLDQGGSLTFYIGANGVNNSVSGTGSATFNGTFNFDLTGADATAGNSWTIVNTSTLSETFAGTFTVQGFTENAGVWTLGNYSFSEATGILTYAAVPEPSSFAALAGLGALLITASRRRRSA